MANKKWWRNKNSKTWRKILKSFDCNCLYCGDYSSNLTFDHVVPKSKGGAPSIYNCVPACPDCNMEKGSLLVDVFILKKRKNEIDKILNRWKLALFRLEKYRVIARKNNFQLKKNIQDRNNVQMNNLLIIILKLEELAKIINKY